MTVTASVLYNLIQCPQRVALDAFGDKAKRDEINAFIRLLWERGTLFERETIAKLDQPFTDLSKASDTDRERLTHAVAGWSRSAHPSLLVQHGYSRDLDHDLRNSEGCC